MPATTTSTFDDEGFARNLMHKMVGKTGRDGRRCIEGTCRKVNGKWEVELKWDSEPIKSEGRRP